MIVDGEMGKDMSSYTGSTTGTTRDNEICSKFTPITWQVDRKCHAISASSFDKMCADMMMQADDMSSDLHAHGSRITVLSKHAANNFRCSVFLYLSLLLLFSHFLARYFEASGRDNPALI